MALALVPPAHSRVSGQYTRTAFFFSFRQRARSFLIHAWFIIFPLLVKMAAIRTHIDKMEVKYESQWMGVRRVKLCGRHDIVNIELTLLGQAADSRPSSKGHPTCPQLRSSPHRSIEWLFIHSRIMEKRRRTSMCQYNNFRVTIRIPEKMCKQNLLNDSNYRHFKNSSRPSAALLVGTMHQLKNYLFHFMRCHRHIVSTTQKA